MAPKKAKSIEEGDKTFSGEDDELSLLLKVIIEDIIERFLDG